MTLVFIFFVFISTYNLHSQRIVNRTHTVGKQDNTEIAEYLLIKMRTVQDQIFMGGIQSLSKDSVIFIKTERPRMRREEITSENIVKVKIEEIASLTLARKSAFSKGILWGFTPGFLLGVFSGGDDAGRIAWGIFWGSVGAYIGGSYRILKGIDVDIPWDGKSLSEKRKILERLSKREYRFPHRLRLSPWIGNISPPFHKTTSIILGGRIRYYLTSRSGLELEYGRTGWFSDEPQIRGTPEYRRLRKSRVDYFSSRIFIHLTQNKRANPFLAWGWGYISSKVHETHLWDLPYPNGQEWTDRRTEISIPLNFLCGIEIPLKNWLSLEGRVGYIWYFWQKKGHPSFQLALIVGPNY